VSSAGCAGWTQSGWSEAGDNIIVEIEIRATGRASGADVIWRHCHVWTCRNGMAIRWALFDDRALGARRNRHA
jgi:hypothetical protein